MVHVHIHCSYVHIDLYAMATSPWGALISCNSNTGNIITDGPFKFGNE